MHYLGEMVYVLKGHCPSDSWGPFFTFFSDSVLTLPLYQSYYNLYSMYAFGSFIQSNYSAYHLCIYFLICVFLGNQTHYLCIATVMLDQLSYRKTSTWTQTLLLFIPIILSWPNNLSYAMHINFIAPYTCNVLFIIRSFKQNL